jgi:hypothetical protein
VPPDAGLDASGVTDADGVAARPVGGAVGDAVCLIAGDGEAVGAVVVDPQAITRLARSVGHKNFVERRRRSTRHLPS